MTTSQNPNETKKPFRDPQLREYGTITSVTNAMNIKGPTDSGVGGDGSRTAA